MFTLTLAQMRRSVGRLTAAGIAIVIGTAFVAATLLAGDVLKRASFDSIAATYADSDLVLVPNEGAYYSSSPLTAGDLDELRGVDGVRALDGEAQVYLTLANGARQVNLPAIATGSDPAFQPLVATSGTFPASAGEIALPESVAERLDVSVGDEVRYERPVLVEDDASDEEGSWVEQTVDLSVVGLVDDPDGAYSMTGGAAVMSDEDIVTDLVRYGEGAEYHGARAVLGPRGDLETVRAALASVAPDDYDVLTKDEAAARSVSSLTSGADIFTGTILAFAAIALLVAALVIANTFQVLVAQRTRTLALLRCVGATKAQLRRSVVLEAAILGIVSSVLGIVLGSGLVQVAVTVLNRMDLDIPVPTTITLTLASVLVPLAVGAIVTIVASLVPARAATRVAPLAALRPADAPTAGGTAGKVRVGISLVLVLGGLAIGVGAMLVTDQAAELALLAGVLGGGISFVGILLSAVYWVPMVVRLAGRPLSRRGASAQLAAANTTRNPRRTAATSTALLIGVTLVAMMSVAAATARSSLDGTLDDTYPVDVSVGSDSYTPEGEASYPLTPALLGELAAVDGVEHVTSLEAAQVSIGWDGQSAVDLETLRGVTPDEARAAVRSPEWFDGLTDGVAVVPQTFADAYALPSGAAVEITGPSGTVTLDTVVSDLPGYAIVVTPTTLAEVDSAAEITRAWVLLSDVGEAATTIDDIREALSEDAVEISGAALERATMQQVIDTILAVIVGLLAIAVVIALIGVANTLSLSVLERRRESATLRAIGLSRRQLRSTLAIEGMLIAGVGAVAGVVLGLGYGWMGSVVVLGSFAEIHLTVPWVQLAILVVVALAAGLLASVLPARGAARTSPVEALAVE